MRPADTHRETGPLGHRIAPGVIFFLALTAAVPGGGASGFSPPDDALHFGDLTPGACVYVCEELTSMCKDAYINENNGDCWLVLDRRHADFTSLDRHCARKDKDRFTAEMTGGKWRLACTPEPAASGGTTTPGSRAIDKLPDIKPF